MGLTLQATSKLTLPIASKNQNEALVFPLARLMIAEEMNGPINPDVLPTVLKRAKNMYALGAGTTSEIILVE
jgi:hypothetical protein